MKVSVMTLRRLAALFLGLFAIFSIANYLLDLGIVEGRAAKGLLVLTACLGVLYGLFIAPTAQEMQEDRDTRNKKSSSGH